MIKIRKEKNPIFKYFLLYVNKIFNFCFSKKILEKKDVLSLLLTVCFLISMFLIPNNKVLFLISATYVFLLFLITHSIYEVVVTSFLPMSLITVGQSYSEIIVPAENIVSDGYDQGKLLVYSFSPFLVLLLLANFLFFKEILYFLLKKKSLIKFKFFILFYFLFLFFSLIGAIQSKSFPVFSFLYVFSDLLLFNSYLLISSYLVSQKNRYKKINIFMFLLIIIILFQFILIVFQFLNKSTLGTILEQSSFDINFGGGADEDSSLFRVIGIFSHPNNLANYLLISLFNLFIFKSFLKLKKSFYLNEKFFDFVIFTILISIAMTLSRAVFLSLFVVFCVYYFLYKKQTFYFIKKYGKFNFKLKYLIVFLPIIWSLILRMVYSLNSFSDLGGVTVRKKLLEESVFLLNKNFYFGVGRGMFISALFRNNPSGVIREFPESVHNGILLAIIENGFLAYFSFLLFIFFLLRKILLMKGNHKLTVLFLLSLLSQFIVMLFHPFTNMISLYTFIMILIVYELDSSYEK